VAGRLTGFFRARGQFSSVSDYIVHTKNTVFICLLRFKGKTRSTCPSDTDGGIWPHTHQTKKKRWKMNEPPT
jgi:hypothetical protein